MVESRTLSLNSFSIVAIVVALCFFLIFFFVPETFWDRTPHARGRSHKRARSHSPSAHHRFHLPSLQSHRHAAEGNGLDSQPITPSHASPLASPKRPPKAHRVGFAVDPEGTEIEPVDQDYFRIKFDESATTKTGHDSSVPVVSKDVEKQAPHPTVETPPLGTSTTSTEKTTQLASDQVSENISIHYTDFYREAPQKSYVQSLKPWNGRLVKDKWLKVMTRPFILFAYPAVLWSSLVYALSVGWLIVLSESVAEVYQNHESYNFTPLQVGLVYISPFVGGVLGTAVAGKISDLIVRFMARKNDGVYEPEFRLIMAIPIAISTVIGLMGFGWSVEERNNWIVPTVFFGVISFGCSLGSTTSVTFVVDSYRQYAGEALVTLNFCKST